MSWQDCMAPDCLEMAAASIDLVIKGRSKDLGGLVVARVLPSARRRLVGPFIFFDHFGPAEFPAGQGIDVRPHPHIGIATVTYLFEGEIMHRDSLGHEQPIRPGAVNWMTAGSGIVHSERTGDKERARDARLHGIQSWIALPRAREEAEPNFFHHSAKSLPVTARDGVRMTLVAGTAYGQESPVAVFSPTFYLDVDMEPGSSATLPEEHEERALYVVSGIVAVGSELLQSGEMAVFKPGGAVPFGAQASTRVMLLGGAAIEGERHIWWNFVSSSRERLERAKADWREGRFDPVPGDDEFIPLPEGF